MRVRVIKNWSSSTFFQQTPKGEGHWNGVQFTQDNIENCDYIIVLNYSPFKIKIHCPPEHVWCVIQEPPNEYFKPLHQADKIYSRVFTQDESLKGSRYIHSHPVLPWHIKKTYDQLICLKAPEKTKILSWITTNKSNFLGHRQRMKFLERITPKVEFDLYGRGFAEIPDKWEGLGPYKYSLAIENYSCRNYWTEKLADCFLTYTVPVYYGCTNLKDYFPDGSYIPIDIKDADSADKINKLLIKDSWKKRLPALIKARELVLNRYQFFPFMANKILEMEKSENKQKNLRQWITIPKGNTFINRVTMGLSAYLTRLF